MPDRFQEETPVASLGKLMDIEDSAFSLSINALERQQQPSRFLKQAQWALAYPYKVVETEWPEDLNWGQICTELNKAARQIGYKIRRSGRKSLWNRGVFQIKIGEKLSEEEKL